MNQINQNSGDPVNQNGPMNQSSKDPVWVNQITGN